MKTYMCWLALVLVAVTLVDAKPASDGMDIGKPLPLLTGGGGGKMDISKILAMVAGGKGEDGEGMDICSMCKFCPMLKPACKMMCSYKDGGEKSQICQYCPMGKMMCTMTCATCKSDNIIHKK